jgi:transposase
VLAGLDEAIQAYEKGKERYEKEFDQLVKKHQLIRLLTSIPGIGSISAVKIVSIVVDPKRFKKRGNFLAYCGLMHHEMMSGGRSYGKRTPRYCRRLKAIFKICTFAAIGENRNNPIRSYYEYLLREKKYADYDARHATSRWVATLAWGVLKTKVKYQPRKGWECSTVL